MSPGTPTLRIEVQVQGVKMPSGHFFQNANILADSAVLCRDMYSCAICLCLLELECK
jgi:hypothetical protein